MKKKEINPDMIIRGKEITIPRRFRFTLESLDHPKITMWVKQVNLDMFNKKLHIKAIENQDLDVLKWVEGLGQKGENVKVSSCDVLTLNNYDGKGDVLYRLVFKKLNCESHICPYNYESSEEVNHSITISFGILEMIPKDALSELPLLPDTHPNTK